MKKNWYGSSYLNFPYRKYIKTAKNGGFCGELLNENDFESALINFLCYEYFIVPMLLRQFRSEDWHTDTAGVMSTYQTANFIAAPMKKHI